MLTKQFIPDTFYDNLVPRPDQMDPLVGEQSLCTVAVVITPARVKAGSKKERQKTTQGELRVQSEFSKLDSFYLRVSRNDRNRNRFSMWLVMTGVIGKARVRLRKRKKRRMRHKSSSVVI